MRNKLNVNTPVYKIHFDGHKEKIKEQTQNYYQEHKEEIKLKTKQYVEENKDPFSIVVVILMKL